MLTTNSHSAKVAPPSGATSVSKVQATTGASLASLITGSNGTHRYHFGWSDPRAWYQIYLQRKFEDVRMPQEPTFANDMTDEQLRAAWILYFGTGEISWRTIQDHDSDEFCIAYECWRRGIIGRLIKHNWETEKYGLKNGYR